MTGDRPSLTAAFVAAARGVGVAGGGADPVAPRVLPAPLGRALTALHRRPLAARALRPALRVVSAGLVDHVALRTGALDHAVREATAAGVDQLVVLGAGLDGRAWRMDALAACDVFEVDHPSTQRAKRARVKDLGALARAVRFVPVDFEHDDLSAALAAAGHAVGRPTVWLWEGVTPYLPQPAIAATLGRIGARSAPGSLLAVTFALRAAGPLRTATWPLVAAGFRLLGEPLRGMLSPGELAGLLSDAGFDLASDTGAREWAARHAGSAALAGFFGAERIAVATSRTR